MALTIKKKTATSMAKSEALKELSREPVKRLNCQIPVSMHTQLKAKVALDPEFSDMTELMQRLIQGYLKDEFKLK